MERILVVLVCCLEGRVVVELHFELEISLSYSRDLEVSRSDRIRLKLERVRSLIYNSNIEFALPRAVRDKFLLYFLLRIKV